MKRVQILLIIMSILGSQLHAQEFDREAPSSNCPKMQVALAAPLLMMSKSDNIYTIFYCNHGGIIAQNAYVEFDLDPFLTIENSDIPVATQNGNTYTFQLGDVNDYSCNSFSIEVSVNNNAAVEQLHCTAVRIFPNSPCNTTGNANQQVTQQSFDVLGTPPNSILGTTTTNYIFEDNVMLNQSPISLDSLGILLGSQNMGNIDNIISDYNTQQMAAALDNVHNITPPANPLIANDCRSNVGYYTTVNQVQHTSTSSIEDHTIKVYPNPMSEYTLFENIGGNEYRTLSLQLLDVAGRIVREIQVDNHQQIKLERDGLYSGVYIYQLHGDDQPLQTGKLMVR